MVKAGKKTKKLFDFQAYLDTEIGMMLCEVAQEHDINTPEFNEAAMIWIEKNAARFNAAWQRHHGGPGDAIAVN